MFVKLTYGQSVMDFRAVSPAGNITNLNDYMTELFEAAAANRPVVLYSADTNYDGHTFLLLNGVLHHVGPNDAVEEPAAPPAE